MSTNPQFWVHFQLYFQPIDNNSVSSGQPLKGPNVLKEELVVLLTNPLQFAVITRHTGTEIALRVETPLAS